MTTTTTQATYTYTIFDANPNTSSGTAWPSHDDVAFEADSDDAAIEHVESIMSNEAVGLNSSDGYDVGQNLYAIVWDADEVIVGEPTYELTAEDLGIEEESREERIARAAKEVDATELDYERWAHRDDSTRRWYVVSADELAELCDYLDDEDTQVSKDAYSHWCAGTTIEEMPEGWTPDTASDFVTVEEMPDYLRASHIAAGNWGSYPHNGAERRLVHRDEAEEIVEADEDQYDHIVE